MDLTLPRSPQLVAPRRGRLSAWVIGSGPPVMLVHGVAFGPTTLVATARALADAGLRAIVPHRAGYAASAGVAPARDLRRQVRDLVALQDDLGPEPAVWAGVSGGATLALAAAIARPDRVGGLVLHEPALGPLAPVLQAMLQAAAGAVLADLDPARGALGLARTLAGPEAWPRVGPGDRQRIRAVGDTVRAEIALFPAFAPAPAELNALRALPVTASVGGRSGPERHAAAAVLTDLAGARLAVTPSAHLVQCEAAPSLAALARDLSAPPRPSPIAQEEDR